jgi:hypothetical protein
MMEIDMQFVLTLVAVFCAYKVGYWNGRVSALTWANEELAKIAHIIKRIGDELHAQQLRKD